MAGLMMELDANVAAQTLGDENAAPQNRNIKELKTISKLKAALSRPRSSKRPRTSDEEEKEQEKDNTSETPSKRARLGNWVGSTLGKVATVASAKCGEASSHVVAGYERSRAAASPVVGYATTKCGEVGSQVAAGYERSKAAASAAVGRLAQGPEGGWPAARQALSAHVAAKAATGRLILNAKLKAMKQGIGDLPSRFGKSKAKAAEALEASSAEVTDGNATVAAIVLESEAKAARTEDVEAPLQVHSVSEEVAEEASNSDVAEEIPKELDQNEAAEEDMCEAEADLAPKEVAEEAFDLDVAEEVAEDKAGEDVCEPEVDLAPEKVAEETFDLDVAEEVAEDKAGEDVCEPEVDLAPEKVVEKVFGMDVAEEQKEEEETEQEKEETEKEEVEEKEEEAEAEASEQDMCEPEVDMAFQEAGDVDMCEQELDVAHEELAEQAEDFHQAEEVPDSNAMDCGVADPYGADDYSLHQIWTHHEVLDAPVDAESSDARPFINATMEDVMDVPRPCISESAW